MLNGLVAERQALGDPVGVGFVHHHGFAQAAQALGVFGLGQMAAAGARAHDLAGAGDFEPFGHGFFRFDAFGTSHKFISIAKERGIYVFISAVASAKCFQIGWLRQVGADVERDAARRLGEINRRAGVKLGEHRVSDVGLRIRIDHHLGGGGVEHQRGPAGLGVAGDGFLNFGDEIAAHTLALVGELGLGLALELFEGDLGTVDFLGLAGGGLFALFAFVSGNGLVVGLVEQLLVIGLGFFQAVGHVLDFLA